jgi:hypothetical protein
MGLNLKEKQAVTREYKTFASFAALDAENWRCV